MHRKKINTVNGVAHAIMSSKLRAVKIEIGNPKFVVNCAV